MARLSGAELHTPRVGVDGGDRDGEVVAGGLGGDSSGERGERDEDDVLTHFEWRWGVECVMS